MADHGRQAVYRAENLVAKILNNGGLFDFHGSTIVLPPEYKFPDLSHVQTYVDRVLAFSPVVDKWGKLSQVQVIPYNGGSRAEYRYPNQIAIPVKNGSWAMREMVVIHEIAHHIDRYTNHHLGHGPTFRSIFLDLIEMVMSPEVALLVRAQFHDAKLQLACA